MLFVYYHFGHATCILLWASYLYATTLGMLFVYYFWQANLYTTALCMLFVYYFGQATCILLWWTCYLYTIFVGMVFVYYLSGQATCIPKVGRFFVHHLYTTAIVVIGKTTLKVF